MRRITMDVRGRFEVSDAPDDPALDPETVELWRILRERTSTLDVGWGVVHGDELRDLVERGESLRRTAENG